MATPGNLKPFINCQHRLVLEFRFRLKNAYVNKTKFDHDIFSWFFFSTLKISFSFSSSSSSSFLTK